MSYKISDFTGDLGRRFSDIIDNHLFLLFFVVFVIFFGMCGIWFDSIILSDNVDWEAFPNKFNTLALFSYSAPLLSVTIFDSVVRFFIKFNNDKNNIEIDLMVWFTILSIIYLSIIFILFAIGAKSGVLFSFYSAIACLMVLLFWALINIDNPSYRKIGSTNSPTGSNDYDTLLRGE